MELSFSFILRNTVQEESLPEGLLRMGKVLPPLPLTLQQCQGHRIRLRSQFTSTWLSVAAKNIELYLAISLVIVNSLTENLKSF